MNDKQPSFTIKTIVIVVSIILVMYLAKIWFFSNNNSKRNSETTQNNSSSAMTSASKTGDVISWKDADDYIGQSKIVEGNIVATYNSGKACFLNFHKDYKKYFTAVIFASAFDNFPENPESYYLNKKVKVNGLIKEYQGKSEIILNSPSQIEIID